MRLKIRRLPTSTVRAFGARSSSSRKPKRVLIQLGFFGGLTHQELARRTDTPLGTVKTRIRSALRKLRAALDGVVAL